MLSLQPRPYPHPCPHSRCRPRSRQARTAKAKADALEVAKVHEASCDVNLLTEKIAISKAESVDAGVVQEMEEKLALSYKTQSENALDPLSQPEPLTFEGFQIIEPLKKALEEASRPRFAHAPFCACLPYILALDLALALSLTLAFALTVCLDAYPGQEAFGCGRSRHQGAG